MESNGTAEIKKPNTLELRHSNNTMINKIVVPHKNIESKSGVQNATSSNVNNVNNFVTIVDECSISNERECTDAVADQTCTMFGQIIDNEDETWELLSNAASWESSFPKEILSDYESQIASISPLTETSVDELPPGWKKIFDSSGSYYWNVDTGKTQEHLPVLDNSNTDLRNLSSENENSFPVLGNSGKTNSSNRWSGNSRDGHMFLVRSLGWLPMENESLKPDISSSAVNSCIRLLSNNRSQIMDGVGVWGEGKDLMLLINNDHLKIVDPLENTVLQSEPIKHIRVWGVGRDSSRDFAYVVKDPSTKIYKCHVFRCDAPAQSIAKQLHTICTLLVKHKKLSKNEAENANADKIPVASAESRQTFYSKYIGVTKVSKPSGIAILKAAILELMKDLDGNGMDVKVTVSPSALSVTDKNNTPIVNCRMRCLSFMGVGDDIQIFGFICVMGGEANCYVLQCSPNAAKLALAVQEACMLRYQKAIDSKPSIKLVNETPQNSKSLKTKVSKLFSGWRKNKS
ncbi:amyloid beta precursor protein binding family B member 2-like [Styela clava]